jgi:hypothetical protein
MKRTVILESIRRKFPDLTVTAISIKLRKSGITPVISQKTERPIERTETEQSVIIAQTGEDIIRDPYAKISDESFKTLLRRLEQSIKKGSR